MKNLMSSIDKINTVAGLRDAILSGLAPPGLRDAILSGLAPLG